MAGDTAPVLAGPAAGVATTLSVTDNRTGKTYEIPIRDGAIRAIDLRRIKADPGDFGLMAYDPAYLNTASCVSRITRFDRIEICANT